VNKAQLEKWEKTRKRGIGWFCIPKILGVFLVITAIDFFLVGRDWTLLVAELRGNLLVAAIAGIVFSIIDWRRSEKRYREHLSEKMLKAEK
jgi:hypothetical protein